jgi:chromosome segregation ATPase
MSLFGKILAIFNVLAAIAFFSIGAMDYSQRTQWTYSHFRHQLALHGLPVSEDENSWRLAGRTIKSDLTANTLDDLFRSVGGNPSKSQVEEVEKAKVTVQAEFNQAQDLAGKKAALTKFLVPLQQTGAERERVRDAIAAAKDDAGLNPLVEQLTNAFEQAKSENANTVKRDLAARKAAIADLLYNLNSDSNWHARVQTVVGLNEYAAAGDRQADRLSKIAQQLRDGIADDRSQFVKEYLSLIPELETLHKELKAYEDRLSEQKSLLNRQTALKNTRSSEVAELNQKIASATQAVAAETAALQSLEQRLFAVQQQYAAVQAQNQKLEAEIRAKETGK